MEITFDPDKEKRNIRKHGLNFSLADLILSDPLGVTFYDRFDGGEHRWHTIGAVGYHGRVLVLVHTDPDLHEDRPIRIIGLREATAQERRRYEDGTD